MRVVSLDQGQNQQVEETLSCLRSRGDPRGPIGSEAALQTLQQRMQIYGVDVTWRSIEEYFALLMEKGTSVNVATYVGHNQIRLSVTGYERRDSTAEELERMNTLAAKAMVEGGAWRITGGSRELAEVGASLWGRLFHAHQERGIRAGRSDRGDD